MQHILQMYHDRVFAICKQKIHFIIKIYVLHLKYQYRVVCQHRLKLFMFMFLNSNKI
jgi:hypothetical protein